MALRDEGTPVIENPYAGRNLRLRGPTGRTKRICDWSRVDPLIARTLPQTRGRESCLVIVFFAEWTASAAMNIVASQNCATPFVRSLPRTLIIEAQPLLRRKLARVVLPCCYTGTAGFRRLSVLGGCHAGSTENRFSPSSSFSFATRQRLNAASICTCKASSFWSVISGLRWSASR